MSLLNLLVFEQRGKVNSIFTIIPAIAYDKKNSEERNKEKILEIFRHDYEKGTYVKYVLDENPSKDISTIEFYYNPLMEKQKKYKNLPYQLTDTIQVIDTFTCLGARFGLDSLSVIVEVCQSNCRDHGIWANIYYVADSEVPVTVITVNKWNMFIEDCHLPDNWKEKIKNEKEDSEETA